MKGEGRTIVAAFVLVACCAGPVLAGGAVLAAVTGFVTGGWGLLAMAAIVGALTILAVRRRSNSSKDDGTHA